MNFSQSYMIEDYYPPMCTKAMPSYLCACTLVGQNILKNSSSGQLRHLKMLYSTNNNQQNHVGTCLYLIQVKAVLGAYSHRERFFSVLTSSCQPRAVIIASSLMGGYGLLQEVQGLKICKVNVCMG